MTPETTRVGVEVKAGNIMTGVKTGDNSGFKTTYVLPTVNRRGLVLVFGWYELQKGSCRVFPFNSCIKDEKKKQNTFKY